MYLALSDLCFEFNLDAYESALNGRVEKFNKIIVYLLSYFPFLYSGFIHDTELIYNIGWFQVSLVGLLYMVNMTIIGRTTIKSGMEQIRIKKVERHNLLMVRKYYIGFKVIEEPNK